MESYKKECNHFWEIDIKSLKDEIPTFTCMFCGKKKKDFIPILDIKELQKEEKIN